MNKEEVIEVCTEDMVDLKYGCPAEKCVGACGFGPEREWDDVDDCEEE